MATIACVEVEIDREAAAPMPMPGTINPIVVVDAGLAEDVRRWTVGRQ